MARPTEAELNAQCVARTQELKPANDARIAALKERLASVKLPVFNFAFSGSGCHSSYHSGAAQTLLDLGLLTDDSKLAGASGGTFTAVALVQHESMLEMHESYKQIVAKMAESDNTNSKEASYNFVRDIALRADLETVRRRVTVAATQVWPGFHRQLWNTFDSQQDLVDKLEATSWIPYRSGGMTIKIGNKRYIDGFFFRVVPRIPGYVRVSCFPANKFIFSDAELSPSIDPEFPYSGKYVFKTLFKASGELMDEMYEHGRKCAVIWGEQQLEKILAETKETAA